jgi:hypothetical protein
LAVFSAIIILAAIPELFFAGLYINPTAIAMSLIMLSHFLVRKYFNGKRNWWILSMAAVLFGFGATIRWNTVLYGFIIVMDILLISGAFDFKRVRTVLLWGIASLFCFFGFLFIQGYTPASIVDVYNFKNQVIDVNSKISPVLGYIQTSTFYTPAMLFLSITGLIYFLIIEKKLFMLSLLSIVLMWLLFHGFFYKMMVTIFPVFFMMIIAGIGAIERLIKSVKLSRVLLIFCCISIWIIGLDINNSKIWGPGFELKEKYYLYRAKSVPVLKEKYNFSLAFLDGCGYPSPEGPRPIGGYAGILLGGKWREFIREDKREYNVMIDSSLKNEYPLIKVEYTYYIENLLLGRGFTSSGSYKNEIYPGLCKRSFHNLNDTIDLYNIVKQIYIKDSLLIKFIKVDSKKSTFIIYGGHYGKPVNLINLNSENKK